MNIYTKPYTYLIGWSELRKYYYGVRYAKGCNPNDLWKTYFTSSRLVKELRNDYGEPDIVQIRKIFNCEDKARIWEHTVLKRMNVIKREDFLNQTDNKAIRLSETHYKKMFTKEVRSKMSAAKKGKSLSKEHRKKISKFQKQRWKTYDSKERDAKISEKNKGRSITWGDKISMSHKNSGIMKGKNNPMYGRSAIKENNLKWYTNGEEDILIKENTQPFDYYEGRGALAQKNKGKKRTKESRKKMSESAKTADRINASKMRLEWNNARLCCLVCKKETSGVWFNRKHKSCYDFDFPNK